MFDWGLCLSWDCPAVIIPEKLGVQKLITLLIFFMNYKKILINTLSIVNNCLSKELTCKHIFLCKGHELY